MAAIEDFFDCDFDPTALLVVTGAEDFWDLDRLELVLAAIEDFLDLEPTAELSAEDFVVSDLAAADDLKWQMNTTLHTI